MWGVPIDHKYFDNTNIVQWMWYFYNDLKDQEDEYVRSRNLLEYHASFTEPEMVGKIIEQRESNRDNVIGTTDEKAFSESVGRIFGRDLKLNPAKDQPDGELHHVDDMLERIDAYEKEQAALKNSNLPYNYNYWSEFDLE
jgi:hypothetical protein